MKESFIIRGAWVVTPGRDLGVADVRVSDGRIASVGADAAPRAGDDVLEADGLKLVMRPNAYGWLGLGSCAIRLVGEDGWVETGDSCKVEVSNDRLRKQLRPFHDGISEVKHVTEFLECVRTRRTPTSNIRVTAQSHVACHCSSICWKLGRELKFDLATETFHDREADGLLQRAQREPYTF